MHQRHPLIGIGAVILFTSCASEEPTAIAARVGPVPREAVGLLIVYSATEECPEVVGSDDTYRYPHTGYEIYTSDGHPVKTVRNALSNWDEEPAQVELPEGIYVVRALSQTLGLVNVPVIIRTGRLTELHLERPRNWKLVRVNASDAHYVHLPNGQIIGYLANTN
jgi:hypothetical protein